MKASLKGDTRMKANRTAAKQHNRKQNTKNGGATSNQQTRQTESNKQNIQEKI